MIGTNIYGELIRAAFQTSASDLTPTQTGLFYFNTSTGLKWYTGAAWVTAATLNGTQVFTNKDYDGGTASNTSRITLPKDTTTNINALTRKQGTLIYDTTTNEVKFDNGSSLTAFSSQIQATASTLGVVKGGTLPGQTSGSAVASEYVGEQIAANINSGTQTFPTGSADDVGGSPLTLGAGVWRITAEVVVEMTGAGGDGAGWLMITNSSNVKIGKAQRGMYISSGDVAMVTVSINEEVSISSTTTYKLRKFRASANGTLTVYNVDATYGDSVFYATRVG